jgi:nitric oxide reductase NorD protein
VGAIESGGYTRIGPAIRHATHILENVRSETKWLMLLTDGKPNDYDRYEGVYGIQDTRKAIREASRSNIHVTALAVDAEARYYLPQMFGNGGFEILRHPQQLPLALLNFYLKILK